MDRANQEQHMYQQPEAQAPNEFASIHHLGEWRGSYPYKMVVGVICILAFSFAAIADALIFLPVIGFALGYSLLALEPPRSLADMSLVLFGILFVAGIVWGAWVCIKACLNSCRNFGSTIYLYAEGLISKRGSKVDVLKWDQVSEVRETEKRASFRGRYTGTVFTYTICSVEGKTFIFTSLIKDIEDLGMSLLVNIMAVLLPKAFAALDAGQTVPFGRFSASPTGISDGKQLLPWKDVGGILTSENVITNRLLPQ